MKLLPLLLLSLTVTLTALAGPPSNDEAKIQGTWIPKQAEMGGAPMSASFMTTTVMKLEKNNYLVTVAGSPDKGNFTLNAAATPKTMDINGTAGPNVGKKMLCIYELQGDTLRICYGLGGSPRPTEFKSPAGTKYFLVTYERKKS